MGRRLARGERGDDVRRRSKRRGRRCSKREVEKVERQRADQKIAS